MSILSCPAEGSLLEGFQGACRGKIRRTPSPVLTGINGSMLPEGREVQMTAHGREQQRADMQLQSEFARQNKCAHFSRGHELEFNAVVGSLASVVWARIDEERMDAVGQSRGAGRVAAESVHDTRSETCFLEKLPTAALRRRLAFVCYAGRQLPGETLKCRSKLAHD